MNECTACFTSGVTIVVIILFLWVAARRYFTIKKGD